LSAAVGIGSAATGASLAAASDFGASFSAELVVGAGSGAGADCAAGAVLLDGYCAASGPAYSDKPAIPASKSVWELDGQSFMAILPKAAG